MLYKNYCFCATQRPKFHLVSSGWGNISRLLLAPTTRPDKHCVEIFLHDPERTCWVRKCREVSRIVGTRCELLGSVGIVGKRRVEATSQDSPLANPGDGHTLGGRTEKWKDKTSELRKSTRDAAACCDAMQCDDAMRCKAMRRKAMRCDATRCGGTSMVKMPRILTWPAH
jgi:hypothetical protein